MSERTQELPWLEYLLEGIYGVQAGALKVLHALGVTRSVNGQAAWPWAWRLTGENLLIDAGQARALAVSLIVVLLVFVLLTAAWLWQRGRPWLVALSFLFLVLAPWPSASVLVTPAHAASFHEQPLPFSDAVIVQGAQHYAQLCVNCHGVRGNGQGTDAAKQPVWPPSFVGPLLWRRSDGDLFEAIQHGARDRHGALSMPGFASQLSSTQTWELLHYLRALGAGEMLRASGSWMQPVHLPDMQLRCRGRGSAALHELQGQRVMLTTSNPQTLLPDPRVLAIWLPQAVTSQEVPDSVDCMVTSVADARSAVALVNGVEPEMVDAAGALQLLTDRRGWLRARNTRGASAWDEEDLVCKAPQPNASTAALTPVAEDQLGQIIRQMEADPVRFVKGGRVH